MHLSRTEELMLKGEHGSSIQKAMEILVTVGDIYKASKLIDVSSVHISGISYRNARESGAKLVEAFASSGRRFVVPTSSNVLGMDATRWAELGFPEDFVEGQNRILRSYERMGIVPIHTCTPYYSGCILRSREDVAWAESAALIFANSVLGARTNRESNPTATSSALTGKTPLYGYHIDENRAGSILVDVHCELKESSDYSAVGFCVGSQVGSEVPVFLFKNSKPNIDDLKSLGAALATSGEVALFHVIGITPEAKDQKSAFHGDKPIDRIRVNGSDTRQALQVFFSGSEEVDHVMIGCPHSSLTELREVASLLEGKRVHPRVKMWTCTSAAVRSIGERNGVVQMIEKAGAHVVTDTCTVNVPCKDLGFKTMATSSTKAAKYCSEIDHLNVFVGSLKQCVQCAIDGRWNGSVS